MKSSHGDKVRIEELNLLDSTSYQPLIDRVTSVCRDSGLSVLINNAGVMENVDMRSGTGDQMVDHYRVNSVGPFLLIRGLLPLLQSAGKMKKRDEKMMTPLVINISATLGSLSSDLMAPGGLHISYRMTKTALNMVTKQTAPDLKKRGVYIVSVHPGWVSTDMGGPKAPMTPQASVEHLIRLMGTIDDTKNGKMLNYDGKIMNW